MAQGRSVVDQCLALVGAGENCEEHITGEATDVLLRGDATQLCKRLAVRIDAHTAGSANFISLSTDGVGTIRCGYQASTVDEPVYVLEMTVPATGASGLVPQLECDGDPGETCYPSTGGGTVEVRDEQSDGSETGSFNMGVSEPGYRVVLQGVSRNASQRDVVREAVESSFLDVLAPIFGQPIAD